MKQLTRVGISLAIALLLYLTVISGTDAQAVWQAMLRLGWGWWSAILALSLFNYGVRFARWHYYLGRLGHRVPVVRDLIIYVAGFALITTPGKAGEAVRSLYLRPFGVSYSHSLAALVAERFSDLVAMVTLAMFGLLTFSRYFGWGLAVLVTLILTLIVIQRPGTVAFLRRLSEREGRGWVSGLTRRVASPLIASLALLRSKPLYVGLGIGLIGWGAEGFATFYIAQQLGIDVGLPLAIGIYAISSLAGALSFMPGGLGTAEAAMGLLFTLAGASPAMAVAATLIIRAATLWFGVLLGLVAFTFVELTGRRHGLSDQPVATSQRYGQDDE